MLKRIKSLHTYQLQEENLDHLYNWYQKQKTTMKVIKSVDAPINFDALTDNAEKLRNLAD